MNGNLNTINILYLVACFLFSLIVKWHVFHETMYNNMLMWNEPEPIQYVQTYGLLQSFVSHEFKRC